VKSAIALSILLGVQCWSQTTATGGASTSGPCSPAVSGDKNTFTIKCGINKEQGQKILTIANKLLANQNELNAVLAKIDEFIHSTVSSGILLSPTSSTLPMIEIGDSGDAYPFDPIKPFTLPFAGETALTIERINDRIVVSAKIRDMSGKMVAEIEHNEWKVRPSLLWDRNYNRSSLEVRDEAGDVVLQLVVLPDRARVQGIWRDKSGECTELVKNPRAPGGLVIMPTYQDCEQGLGLIKITPIFMYPSDLHFGELLNP
jgi:hypothetical protein